MSKIRIFKSIATRQIYIETVTFGYPEDFKYTRTGEWFTIDRINTKVLEVNNANYRLFLDGNGDEFDTADDFETYLIDIFQVENIITQSHIDSLQLNINSEETARTDADNVLQSKIDDEETARTDADAILQSNIDAKLNSSSVKNSIENDSEELQLVNDEDSPGNNKIYGTNNIGQKGWYDGQVNSGNIAYVNKGQIYKTFTDSQLNINVSTIPFNILYKPAVSGSYDNTMFSPISNGVQLLKDLENVTIIGNTYVIATSGSRIALGLTVNIDGVNSQVESSGYIRRTGGHDEDQYQIIETFPFLSAGTIITIQGRRTSSIGIANGIEDKGFLSISGLEPDSGSVITGFPTPVITQITLA